MAWKSHVCLLSQSFGLISNWRIIAEIQCRTASCGEARKDRRVDAVRALTNLTSPD
jgi:hypothetical protein